MSNLIKNIIVALKGFLMGAANVIPGVSGGTMALLTGIYEDIINALNSVMVPNTWKDLFHGKIKKVWNDVNGTFLLWLLIGVVASILSLANLMKYVMAWYPVQTWGFFFGMIAASAVVMLVGIKNWKVTSFIWVIIGGILGVVVCTLSPTETPDNYLFIFLCGAIAICTMILPGISGSFILLILGKYEYIMEAVSDMNIPVLIVFCLGCLVGILAFAKFLHWLLSKYEKQTMLVLIGFIIGSLIKVWPWNDPSAILQSQFLHSGMDETTAKDAVDALVNSGAPLRQAITDMHVTGATIWALIGVAIVGILEYFNASRKKN